MKNRFRLYRRPKGGVFYAHDSETGKQESLGTKDRAEATNRIDRSKFDEPLNKPADEFLPDLKGIIFLNPQTNQWEADDQYLSGNVRDKLVVADAAAVTDGRFAKDVEALKSIQPEDFPRHGN